MADLKLDVDISAVLQADKALRDFEGRFSDLERAAKRGVASQNKLVAVFDRLDKAGISLSQVYRSMERDLDSNAKTAARLENEFRDLALSGKSARDSARAMEQAFRQQEQAAEQLARTQAEAAARTLDLKRRFKEGYASSEAMQMQFRDLDEALRRGIITLEEYRKQLERIKAGQTGFAASANNLANKMSRSSVAIQQFGYQAGDFLVQVQSGTNAFVAFGQQATQLAGLLTLSLNPKMVILGAALSVLIPLGTAAAAMFARTRQEAEGAAEGVDDFDSAIKSLDSSLREWVRTKQAAELGITPEQMLGGEALEKAEEDLRSATEALARLQAAQEAIARMPMSPEGAVLALLGFGGKAGATQAEIDAAVANVEAAQERLRMIREREEQERSAQQAKVKSFIAEQTALLEDQTNLYLEIARYGENSLEVERERARQARISYQTELLRQKVGIDLIPTMMAQYDAMVQAREEAEKTTAAMQELDGLNLSSLTAEVDFLTRRLNISRDAAMALALAMPIGTSGGDAARGGRGMTLGMGGRRPNFDLDLGLGRYADRPERGAAPGIGGFAQSLLTEMEQIELYRENALEQLENFNSLELELLGGHAEAKLRIEEEYQNRLRQLEQNQQSQRLGDVAGFFGAMASVAQSGGDKMVRVASAFSAAQALINSYTAYTEMLKDPAFVGRPFARFAAAASVLGAGLKMVSAIKGVGGGGGGGGASAPGMVDPIGSSGAASPQRVVIEGIDRDSLISGEQLSRLFDRLYEENSERGIVFSVAR